jgi:hypothetical protein
MGALMAVATQLAVAWPQSYLSIYHETLQHYESLAKTPEEARLQKRLTRAPGICPTRVFPDDARQQDRHACGKLAAP